MELHIQLIVSWTHHLVTHVVMYTCNFMATYDYKYHCRKCSRFGQQSHYNYKMIVEMDKISFSGKSPRFSPFVIGIT